MLQESDHLLQLLLCLSNTGYVIEHDTGFSFHHEAGLALAELHRLTRATGHAVVATCQEDQRADQQQREQKIAQQSQSWRSCLGGVNVKADALFLESVHQFRGKTRQINAKTLNAVVEIGVDRFNHGVAATVVDVHGGDTTRFHVIEETSVAHPRHGCIAWCLSGATASIHAVQPTIADHLPANQQHDADWQKPQSSSSPALIHDAEK